LVRVHGFDYATAGLFIAVRGLGGLIAVMVSGAAADRFGEIPVVMVLLAGTGVSAGIVPHLPGYWGLLLSFLFLGAFANAVQPAFSSLIVKAMPARLWTEAYAAEYWALNVGFAVTALLGGLIVVWSFAWLFYLEAAGAFLALAVVIKFLPRLPGRPESNKAVSDARSTGGRGRELVAAVSLAARDRLALAVIGSVLLFSLSLAQMTATLPLDMEALGYSPNLYGYVIAWNGGVLVLLQIPAGRWLALRPQSKVMGLAALVSAVGYALLSCWCANLALILLCLTIWTVGEMMDAPVRNAVVSALAQPASRGRYLGLISAALTVGYSLGPWLGGLVLQSAGRVALWLGAGACAVAAAAIRFAIAGRVERRTMDSFKPL